MRSNRISVEKGLLVHLPSSIRLATLGILSVSALAISACGADEETGVLSPSGSVEVTSPTETPTFEAQDVSPRSVSTDEFDEAIYDEGLNVEYHFQGSDVGNYGGTIIHVAITNLNEVPLPPSALSQPTLSYNSGGTETTASLLEAEVPEGQRPVQVPLDLPLGAGATTNLHYTFDVARGNLSDAQFQIGNVIYDGNLVM